MSFGGNEYRRLDLSPRMTVVRGGLCIADKMTVHYVKNKLKRLGLRAVIGNGELTSRR